MKKNTKVGKSAKEYYALNVRKEWDRLVKDAHHGLEFETTLRFLKKHLPKKGLILDAGGGPGRYTIELAKKGYNVVLLDIAPANLEFAKRQIKKAKVQNRVKEVAEGSIVDLSKFANNTFDAVICLGGPLSHVPTKKERNKAVSELIRVAKRGAPIFISVIGRLGVFMITPRHCPEELSMSAHLERVMEKGDDYRWWGKYFSHYFLPEELERLFSKKNIKILECVGLEGIGTPYRKEINKLFKENPRSWKNWLKVHYKFCTHPAVVGTSLHTLLICKKL